MLRYFSVIFFIAVLSAPELSEGRSGPRAFPLLAAASGWGQHYSGKAASARRFWVAELGLWGGYLGLRHLQDIRATHFRAYAAEHARARTGAKTTHTSTIWGFTRADCSTTAMRFTATVPARTSIRIHPSFSGSGTRKGRAGATAGCAIPAKARRARPFHHGAGGGQPPDLRHSRCPHGGSGGNGEGREAVIQPGSPCIRRTRCGSALQAI